MLIFLAALLNNNIKYKIRLIIENLKQRLFAIIFGKFGHRRGKTVTTP
jgi:hypothetical protein